VRRVYVAHGLASVGSNLLIPAFFFYAAQVFHWDSRQSLMLVGCEGVVYIGGALAANKLASLFGRRCALILIQSVMALLCAVAWLRATPAVVVAVLLVYTMVSASGWPIFESLISAAAGPKVLSKRIGLYNLVWSGIGTISLAFTGTIINRFMWGMFFIPMVAHVVAVLMFTVGNVEPEGATPLVHAAPEPKLLRQRRLALALSRIALPATYIVLYSLVALMPSLRVIRSYGLASQTVVASIWMGARFSAFLALGGTSWWHSRPRVLLLASALMLVAFLGVTLRPADFSGDMSAPVTTFDRLLNIGWQIPLGLTMGLIYAASLYFGMVLSDGSTEHGGYHEALIGVGQAVGPAAALAAQRIRPDDSRAGAIAVAGALSVSVLLSAMVTARHAAQSKSDDPKV